MKILVTGGAGFIGSHLVEKLIAVGHEVWSLDDFSTGKKQYIDPILTHPQHHFIQGSVLDRSLLHALISRVDVIFHLAAVLGVKNCVEDPLKVISGNIDGTKNVLEEAFQQKKKVIFASTSEVYGKNNRLPFHEDDDRVFGSASIYRWCYAVAKSVDEHLCLAYAKNGLPVTVLRYFNAYGPRAAASAYGGVIPRFITAALQNKPLYVYGTGKQTRCFTYIADTVEATALAIRPEANGLIINIGSNEQISIKKLAKQIIKMTNSTSEIISVPYQEAYGSGYEDMLQRQPDITRLRKVLGFLPKVSRKEGLEKTIQWYKEQMARPEEEATS